MLDFDLNASEFQGTECVQEEDEYSPLTAGASSSGLIPPFEPSEYVQSALDRELRPEPLTDQVAPQPSVSVDPTVEMKFAKAAHLARAITGAKYFTTLAALDEQDASGPWAAEDPSWSRV